MSYCNLLSNLLEKAAGKHSDIRAELDSRPTWGVYVSTDLAQINEVEIRYLGGLEASPVNSVRSLEGSEIMADELDGKGKGEVSFKKSVESTTPKIIKRSLAINKRLSGLDDLFSDPPGPQGQPPSE
jgi:hypothetical protein